MAMTKPKSSQITYSGTTVNKVLEKSVLSYDTYTAASAAAATLPEGQMVEAPDAAGRLSMYKTRAGVLQFDDYVPDVIRLQSYSALRAYSGKADVVDITGFGIAGRFVRDDFSTLTDDGGATIVDSLGRRWIRSGADELTSQMFGITGDEADATDGISKLLAASAGRRVKFEPGKTYNFTQFSIPSNTVVIATGATFNRTIASDSFGVTVNSGVSIDSLVVTAQGGDVREKTVRIAGSLVRIGLLSVKASTVGVYNKPHFGVELTHPNGSQIKDIQIDRLETANYNSHFYGKNLDGVIVKSISMSTFRVGFYFIDIKNSAFSSISIKGTSPNCYGTRGENAILLEATSKYATSNVTFSGGEISGSGEHGVRLGGAYSMKNIYFNAIEVAKSGSAIEVNHPAATAWHGGCGFKVLGGTTLANQFHENIFLTDCVVEDVNDKFGNFPTGHNTRNFAAFQLGVVWGVHLSNCRVRKKDNTTYSCAQGLDMINAHHVYVDNPDFLDCYDSALYTYEAGDVGTYPGYDGGCSHIYVNGGQLHTARNIGQVVHIAGQFTGTINVVNFPHTDIHINSTIRGCTSALRVNPLATGKAARVYVNSTYYDSSVDDATTTFPVVTGTQVALLTLRAPWRPNQVVAPEGVGGSMIQDTLGKGTYVKNGTNVWKLL